MKLLLDTHIALWSVSGDAKLASRARAMLTGADALFVSVASIWEIAIKHALRRAADRSQIVSATDALALFGDAGFDMLDIVPRHAAAIDVLPLLHGDPFDRLLVAQAQTEAMKLMTHDAKLGGYGDFVLVV